MKVIETVYTGHNWMSGEDGVDRCVEVKMVDEDGERHGLVSFSEGEPEDMTLGRDLSDAYGIAGLVSMAYDLGRRGVEVSFESNTEEY